MSKTEIVLSRTNLSLFLFALEAVRTCSISPEISHAILTKDEKICTVEVWWEKFIQGDSKPWKFKAYADFKEANSERTVFNKLTVLTWVVSYKNGESKKYEIEMFRMDDKYIVTDDSRGKFSELQRNLEEYP